MAASRGTRAPACAARAVMRSSGCGLGCTSHARRGCHRRQLRAGAGHQHAVWRSEKPHDRPATAVEQRGARWSSSCCRTGAGVTGASPATETRLHEVLDAHGSTLTAILGIGDIGAATILAIVGDLGRLRTAGHFAANNSTAPIEASSGDVQRHRGATTPTDPPNQCITPVSSTCCGGYRRGRGRGARTAIPRPRGMGVLPAALHRRARPRPRDVPGGVAIRWRWVPVGRRAPAIRRDRIPC
jgi:hypothetical protein